MLRYILKRLILAIISLFILMTIVYLLTASFADIPYTGGDTSPETIEAWKNANGFNDPIIVRYGNYLKDFFTGNFGKVYSNNNGFTYIPNLFFKLSDSITESISFLILSLFNGERITTQVFFISSS